MRLVKVGYNHTHDEKFYISRPNGSGDYLFLLIKTAGIFIINNKEYRVNKNTVIIYREGTAQQYRADTDTYTDDWLHFQVEDNAWFDSLNLPMDRLIENCSYILINEMSQLVRDLTTENSKTGKYTDKIVNLKLKCFFMRLAELLEMRHMEQINVSHFEVLQSIRNEIHNKPYLKWNIESISAKTNISISHFEHLYKQVFGVSCMSDIVSSRIDYAKYQLAKSDYKIKYIAEICGYENEVHFMRQFKQKVGLTPSQFRKSQLESIGN